MNKSDFLKEVATKSGLNQSQVDKALKAIAEVVVEDVRDNDGQIVIGGLGTFKCKKNPARTGRNPLNGTTIEVKASRTIAFRPLPSLKKIDE